MPANLTDVQFSLTDSVAITTDSSDKLLVWCGVSGGDVTALTDNTSDTWTKIPNEQDAPGSAFFTQMWYLSNPSVGTHIVTRTGGFALFEAYYILAYSVVETSSALDEYTSVAESAAVDPSPTSGNTGTLAQTDELVVGCISTQADIDYSGVWLEDFIEEGYSSQGNRGITPAWKNVSSNDPVEAIAGSMGAGGDWHCLVATFRNSAGGSIIPILLGSVRRRK